MDALVQSVHRAKQARDELQQFKQQCAGHEQKFQDQRNSLVTLIESAVEQNNGKPIMDARRNIAYFKERKMPLKTVVDARLLDAVRAITPPDVKTAWQELRQQQPAPTFADAVKLCLRKALEQVCGGTMRKLVVTNRRPNDLGPIEPRPVSQDMSQKITEYLSVSNKLKQVRQHKRKAYASCLKQQQKSSAEVTQMLGAALQKQKNGVPSVVCLVPAPAGTTRIAVSSDKDPKLDLPDLPPLLAETYAEDHSDSSSDDDDDTQSTMMLSVPGLQSTVSVLGCAGSAQQRKSAGQSPRITEFFSQLKDADLGKLPTVSAPADVDKVWNSDFVTNLEAALLDANARIKLEVAAMRAAGKVVKPRLLFKK